MTTILAPILRHFTPAWFAAVMGTGVLAVLTETLAADQPWLHLPALILHFGNLIDFAGFAILFALHCRLHPGRALDALRHPAQAAFHGTMPLALLTVAAQMLTFHPEAGLGFALFLWRAAVLVGFGLNFTLMYRLLRHPEVHLEQITPVQFLPAVGLVVIPVTGAPLLACVEGTSRDISLLLNAAGLGAGSLLYLGLFCLLIHRHILHPPLPEDMTPALWIHMAPLGWIPVSLLGLAAHLDNGQALACARLLGLCLWGAGLWWLVMAGLLTLRARLRGRLPFSLVWWSMIFPLGALVTLTLRLAEQTALPVLRPIGVGLWMLLVLLWAAALIGTVRGTLDGSLFGD